MLEFIIWLLHGKDVLKEFHNERRLATSNEDRFWSPKAGRGRVLHPTASKWIQKLLEELKGRPDLRAWRELLKLVKTYLLVAVLDQRKYIWDFWPQLQQVHKECSADSSHTKGRSDMILTKRSESTARMIDDVDVSISQQVSSTEMLGLNFANSLYCSTYVLTYNDLLPLDVVTNINNRLGLH